MIKIILLAVQFICLLGVIISAKKGYDLGVFGFRIPGIAVTPIIINL